jgi:hypothetical protein
MRIRNCANQHIVSHVAFLAGEIKVFLLFTDFFSG